METVIAERLVTSGAGFRPLVYWYLSFRCNLSCRHCWVNSSPYVDTSTDQILDVSSRLVEVDPKMVILTGGEPLLRRDTPQILASFIDHGFSFSVETNGLLVGERYLNLFGDALDRGLQVWISVSLDGGTAQAHEWVRGRGSFKPTLRGLRKLKDVNVPFGVQCVVNKQNLLSIPELFAIADGLDFNAEDNLLAFVVVNPIGRGARDADELTLTFDEYQYAYHLIAEGLDSFRGSVLIKVPPAAIPTRYLRKFMAHPRVKFLTSCSFPLLGILPDGTLSVCALTGKEDSLVLGDAKSDSLADVVRSRIEPLREEYENATLTGICADCVFRHSCKGSCRAFAYSEFGSFLGPHPLCDALDREGLFPDAYRGSYGQRLGAVPAAGPLVGLRAT